MTRDTTHLRSERELARRFGVRQAMRFLIEVHDEPSLAREIGRYVLPSPQWRKRLTAELFQQTLDSKGDLSGRGEIRKRKEKHGR